MASVSLVEQVRKLADALRSVVRVLPTPGSDEFDPEKRDESNAAFLFELKILYVMLERLDGQGWTVAVERKGARVHFARRPLPKSNASHFTIEKDGVRYQLVHGTQVID